MIRLFSLTILVHDSLVNIAKLSPVRLHQFLSVNHIHQDDNRKENVVCKSPLRVARLIYVLDFHLVPRNSRLEWPTIFRGYVLSRM